MTKCSARLSITLFNILVCSTAAHSQIIPFNSVRWEIQARESRVMDHLGRTSLYLKSGLAIIKDSQFTDGVIEFDIAVTSERGFMGAFWRMQDDKNYEEFYFRPHQSGNPDANQYTPVFNGVPAWQLYYGEGYGAPIKYDYDQWMHAKIVVSGKNAEVYIKDMETPALFVNEQKREIKSGNVGLSAGNFAPAYFSNFSFSAMNSPTLKGKAKAPQPAPTGTVMSWMISNAFAGKSLEKKYQLTASDKQQLSWKKLACESTGLANLARVQRVTENANTVFAKLIITSDSEQMKKLTFGFSDEVKVYFNDCLISSGSDIYQSMDYRFLGTIGLFDDVYLPLKKGDNELLMAVTENFGGWGIKAQFEDMEGIKIIE